MRFIFAIASLHDTTERCCWEDIARPLSRRLQNRASAVHRLSASEHSFAIKAKVAFSFVVVHQRANLIELELSVGT